MKLVRRIAIAGVLIAVAFVLSWIERIFPIPFPVPGLKLGLANIVTLVALYKLDAKSAFFVLIGRCLLSAALFGSVTQLAFALTGGILSLLTMMLLKHSKNLSVFGVSMAGAIMHNIGQVTAAAVIMQTLGLYSYLLFLLPIGLPTGFLIGFVYNYTSKAIKITQ